MLKSQERVEKKVEKDEKSAENMMTNIKGLALPTLAKEVRLHQCVVCRKVLAAERMVPNKLNGRKIVKCYRQKIGRTEIFLLSRGSIPS